MKLTGGVDRVRRMSHQILDKYQSKFDDNYDNNKEMLETIAIVRSKQLRNKIAGYITKIFKREREFKDSQAQSTVEEKVMAKEDEIDEESTVVEESQKSEEGSAEDESEKIEGDSPEPIEMPSDEKN